MWRAACCGKCCNTSTHSHTIHIYVRMVHSHDPFAHTARHVAGSPATHQHLTYLYVRMTHPHDSFAHGTACRRKSCNASAHDVYICAHDLFICAHDSFTYYTACCRRRCNASTHSSRNAHIYVLITMYVCSRTHVSVLMGCGGMARCRRRCNASTHSSRNAVRYVS